MLEITTDLGIPDDEIEIVALRAARGPGGQNVNKVASAVELRFDALTSPSLPEAVKARLLALPDRRISREGVVVIRAQRFRSRERNREDALARLALLLRRAHEAPKLRVRTRPPRQARERRLADKAHRARLKQARGRVPDD
jgi:ribosome-associated protein